MHLTRWLCKPRIMFVTLDRSRSRVRPQPTVYNLVWRRSNGWVVGYIFVCVCVNVSYCIGLVLEFSLAHSCHIPLRLARILCFSASQKPHHGVRSFGCVLATRSSECSPLSGRRHGAFHIGAFRIYRCVVTRFAYNNDKTAREVVFLPPCNRFIYSCI